MDTQAPIHLLALVEWAEARLSAADVVLGHGTDNARDEAAWLVLAGAGYAPDRPDIEPRTPVGAEAAARVRALVDRRIDERRPTAYLTGRAWFAGLAFGVDQRVLVPRSPLAEPIAERFAPWIGERPVERILEIGTGSGCIAAACAHAFPEAAVDATDVDPGVLALAADNLHALGLGERVALHRADLFDGLPERRYDLIVSNPPYVDAAAMERLPPEYRHEPASALAAGPEGLDVIVPLLEAAADWLTPHGVLAVETGRAGAALAACYPRLPFTWLEFAAGGDGAFLLEASALQAGAAPAGG
jgi:ribosomal protein L3 glutamine methyltransferase